MTDKDIRAADEAESKYGEVVAEKDAEATAAAALGVSKDELRRIRARYLYGCTYGLIERR